MALTKTPLISALTTAFASFPVTADLAATQVADAYHAYAILAQHCGLLNPTLVMYSDLKDGLKDSMEGRGDYATVAQEWADAFTAYWTGALFGATGAVTSITGSAAFKAALETMWENLAGNPAVTFAISAQQHGDLLDAFTKTVNANDTVLPSPPGTGCGPAPIF